jgi:hypothetical protein
MGAAFSNFASTPWALAAVEDEAAKYFAVAQDLLIRKLSGLGTLVDVGGTV